MNAFRIYWRSYGGLRALLVSPYLWSSGVLFASLKPIWYIEQKSQVIVWPDWAISAVPSILSFSLGAMAIFLALANEKFLRIISQNGSDNSYLMKLGAAFFHFILVQFLSLGFAFLATAYPNNFFSPVGFWIFLYALACGIAAAAALLEVVEVLNVFGGLE